MHTALSSRSQSALAKGLPYTGWLVASMTCLFGLWFAPSTTCYSPWPIWTTPVAIAGGSLGVGMCWTMAAALIHTRGGLRAMQAVAHPPARMQSVLSARRIATQAVVLALTVGLVDLAHQSFLFTMIWEQNGWLTTVIAAAEVLWRDLGFDLFVSVGIVFAFTVIRAKTRDILNLRRPLG
ncbi:MAG: hypothetical protein CL927_11540 [Deltaproteobacteria bacterium]|nr:hypothetical protein [Deltaproteobacteria bacterium]HCH63467.1 hypothetical protein [Deltaproteobacteria bacterium]